MNTQDAEKGVRVQVPLLDAKAAPHFFFSSLTRAPLSNCGECISFPLFFFFLCRASEGSSLFFFFCQSNAECKRVKSFFFFHSIPLVLYRVFLIIFFFTVLLSLCISLCISQQYEQLFLCFVRFVAALSNLISLFVHLRCTVFFFSFLICLCLFFFVLVSKLFGF